MAPVIQKVDNATHCINLYPVESAIDFPTYPLDSDEIAELLQENIAR